MMLIISLNGIKAEHDHANHSHDLDVPPVLLDVLMKLRHGMFVRKVLDPYREHLAKFWSPQNIDQIKANHCTILKAYNTDNILCIAIDNHDVITTFNDAWGYLPGQYECMRSFCNGLAIVFANTTSVESDFSIFKWEMDANHTALMHLSLEGIFQAKQRTLL
jgi:ankyrin repeat protein